MALGEINRLSEEAFVERFGAVFEHSPWIAQAASAKRPFSSIEQMHETMMAAVREAPRARQLELVRAHPELAGAEAKEGALTIDSSTEQGRLGFTRLSNEELARMAEINRAYRARHGFPCIVALRLHGSRESVIAEMERRIGNDTEAELAAALEQIGHITRGRLEKMLRRA